MFKIEDDLKSGCRVLKFGDKSLIRWYRFKTLFHKIDRLSQVVATLMACQSATVEAQGVLRDIQNIQIRFLSTFAQFAEENQITYWLDFGTLLGAVRTGRFIPWDDDVDLSVPREDYQRLLSLSDRLPKGYYFVPALNNCLIKLKHKDLPSEIGLDLFAVDLIANKLSLDESIDLTKRILEVQKTTNNKPLTVRKPILDEFIRSSGIDYVSDFESAKMLCYGTEFWHKCRKTIFFDKNFIYPLRSIEFEGESYPCPKGVVPYLTLVYQDYRKIDWSQMPHISTEMFTLSDLLAISTFIENNKI